MSDILRMLELFEMNHEFGPAAQRDLEEIIAAVRATNAPAEQVGADDVVPKALDALSSAMQSDPDFAWAWHCNIAMTAHDAGAPHDMSNVWAANFMQRAFGVDTLTRVNAIIAAAQQQKAGG